MKDIYRGTLVRLGSESSEVMAKALARWDWDAEMHPLAGTHPAQLWSGKKLREFIEKDDEKNGQTFRFSIRTLAEDKLIGMVSLWVHCWAHSDAWLGIMVGDREYWGRGYGTDAVHLVAQYGFIELNLRRISLRLHACNERAWESCQKAGFKLEGRARGDCLRGGIRYDSLWMGLLREEWLGAHGAK